MRHLQPYGNSRKQAQHCIKQKDLHGRRSARHDLMSGDPGGCLRKETVKIQDQFRRQADQPADRQDPGKSFKQNGSSGTDHHHSHKGNDDQVQKQGSDGKSSVCPQVDRQGGKRDGGGFQNAAGKSRQQEADSQDSTKRELEARMEQVEGLVQQQEKCGDGGSRQKVIGPANDFGNDI